MTVARAPGVAALAATLLLPLLLLLPQEAGGFMLPRQFHHVRQDISFSPDNMLLRFGVKVAPVILMAGSLPDAASAATGGDSISSSAQPTSADDVGLGS
ncbi:unnamed protein product, partial [Ectocarpus sp. 12 AP-2014]